MLVVVNYGRKFNVKWEVLDKDYKVIAIFKTMKEAQQYVREMEKTND